MPNAVFVMATGRVGDKSRGHAPKSSAGGIGWATTRGRASRLKDRQSDRSSSFFAA
jgi:hypothetical protein